MNDKELADKIVALGVGALLPAINKHGVRVRSYSWYEINGDELIAGSIDSSAFCFVRNWLVAGELMEKSQAIFIEKLNDKKWAVRSDKPYGEGKTREWYENESLPRAICEACVDALFVTK